LFHIIGKLWPKSEVKKNRPASQIREV
jgi:hypothetical protein